MWEDGDMDIQAKSTLKASVRQPREVALVAFGESMALMNDLPPHVPIWTLNASEDHQFPREPAALFEIHPIRDVVTQTRRWEHLQKKHNYPIYMQQLAPGIPSGVLYPIDLMSESVFENIYLGDEHADYWDSSLPYMCALAEHQGYDIVHIYGFELRTDTEYRYQRPGAALLIGWLGGRGIKVVLPENTSLLPPTRYGYTEYQMISRQNFEQWLQQLTIEENDWQGKLNVANTQVMERQPESWLARFAFWLLDQLPKDKKLLEAEEARRAAFKEMAMRGGAIYLCHQAIEICDRKTSELKKVKFKDRYFRMEEGEVADAKELMQKQE